MPAPLFATMAVAGLVGGTALPAFAAAPGNDTIAGATAVGLGFSETLDTTEAVTDADDVALNADCGAPATDASVWYAFTGESDGGVVVDVSGSDYSAGVIVAGGAPGDLYVETCGPGSVGFYASAGTTYYVMAFDDQDDGSGNGGSLAVSFASAPPPPSVTPVVDATAKFNSRTGHVTLSGTLSCTDAEFVELYGTLSQQVGRMIINGEFWLSGETPCDGLPHRWTAQVKGSNGVFKGGKAAAVTFSFACGAFDCSEGYTEQKVQISGGGKA